MVHVSNIFRLYFLGNAWNEPGSSHDAHARPATLHAPSEHDAPSRNGPWPDAPWCYTTWRDDARTDAWTNASAGRLCLLSDRSSCPLKNNNNLFFPSVVLAVIAFFFPHRFQKTLPITSSSSPTCLRRRTNSCSPCSSTSQ